MALWADFSGPPPGAAALLRAGFSGVIRYIGLGSEGKQIHGDEYQDYTRNGVRVLLVAELGTNDAWGALDDYATGVARAQQALADARAEDIPDYVGIACAADAHATSASQIADAVQYAKGFAAVLGKQRTGFYGFGETSQAVHAADVVGWHWRCGSKPSAEDSKWVNFWQRNVAPATVTVNGTVCDINETLAPIGDDNMPLTDQDFGKLWYTPVITLDPNTPQARQYSAAAVLQAMTVFLDTSVPELLEQAHADVTRDEANQAALLTAIGESRTQVDLTGEQIQVLLAAMTDSSKRALREVLGSLDNPAPAGQQEGSPA